MIGIAIAIVMITSVGLGLLIGQQNVVELPSIGENLTRCETQLSENPSELSIYVTDEWLAKEITERLCQDPVVGRQFGAVVTTLGHNDFDTYRNINYGLADLALVKQNHVSAFASEAVHGYKSIAQYPDYRAYFIGKSEKPLLSKEYFLGKRIGLLDYPSSRSGHIAPMTQLKSLDIDASNATFVYFNSHQELREKLLIGDVDIIASYWDEQDSERFSENYITQINANITGSRWYLRGQTRNTDLICAIQRNLLEMSQSLPASYYRGIEATVDCPDV
jgi:hypothetical protein